MEPESLSAAPNPVATPEASPDPSGAGRGSWVRPVLLAAAALIVLVIAGRYAGQYTQQFASWVGGLGLLGALVFALGYAVAVVAFIPGSLLTLAAGGIYGVMWGTLLVFGAATTGSTAAFLVARYGARRWVEKKLAAYPHFAAIDRAVAGEGLRIVCLLRLSPVFPFSFLNYALGLTQVRLVDYVVASVGMLPGTLLYVYLGHVAASVAAAAGGGGAGDASKYVLLVLGLAATVAVTIIITRIARRALREATGEATNEGGAL